MGLAHTHLIIALDCHISLKPLTYFNTWCMWTLSFFALGILNCAGCLDCSEGWGLHPAAQEGLDVSGLAHRLCTHPVCCAALGCLTAVHWDRPRMYVCMCVDIHQDYGVLESKWLTKGACYVVICSQLQLASSMTMKWLHCHLYYNLEQNSQGLWQLWAAHIVCLSVHLTLPCVNVFIWWSTVLQCLPKPVQHHSLASFPGRLFVGGEPAWQLLACL